MIFAVVDTETTGLGPRDQVCEIAVVWVPSSGESVPAPRFSFVKPSVPVSIEARAVHHIPDSDLESAPTMQELMAEWEDVFPRIKKGSKSETVMVAHNLAFDRRLILQSGVNESALPLRSMCTVRLAKHVFPGAPSYSNQVLRYYLNLKPRVGGEYPAHRAIADAGVTAALMVDMLCHVSADDLLRISGQPALLSTCRIGKKYAGQPWATINDPGYLRWVLNGDFDEDVKYTARYWLSALTRGQR